MGIRMWKLASPIVRARITSESQNSPVLGNVLTSFKECLRDFLSLRGGDTILLVHVVVVQLDVQVRSCTWLFVVFIDHIFCNPST
jgi:hypothetical protein